MAKVAALIHTCDSYSWTWPIFFSCLNKWWDYSIPTYFANEDADYDCGEADQIKTGVASWSSRLYHTLNRMQIDGVTDIIYLQEDFWTKKIDMAYFEAVFTLHLSHNSDITKLATNFEFTYDRIATLGRLPVNKQKKNSPYVMSHQPIAFFNVSYLMDTLDKFGESCGPSEFELGATKMINDGKLHTSALCVGPVYYPNQSVIWTIEHGVRQGKLIPEAEQFLTRMNLGHLIPYEISTIRNAS